MNFSNRVFLLDGNSIFFRAFHGIRELRRSDGVPTNAVYGYVMVLRNLLAQYQPQALVCAFDGREKTFRNDQYDGYKANRQAPPEELLDQIPKIFEITDLLGIPRFAQEGYEADDLIGTMAVWLAEQGRQSVIVSGDKDLLQLVNKDVCMLRLLPTQEHQVFTEDKVVERFGVPPAQMIDLFALIGDASDNIPGVRGVGEKTARQMIQDYQTLETLYENLDAFKGKKRENLEAGRENAFLSRDLFRIKTDVPMALSADVFERKTPDVAALRDWYSEMEFRTFASEFVEETVRDQAPAPKDYQTVETIDQLNEVVAAIEQAGYCAIDTESTSLNVMEAQLVGLAVSIDDHQGWYVPLGHRERGNLPWDEAQPLLAQVLENEAIGKVGHHLKYDLHVLRNAGLTVRGVRDDTLIASYLVQPDRQTHKLDTLAEWLLGMKMTPITDLIGDGKKSAQERMDALPVEQVSPYACEDTDATLQLGRHFSQKIEEMALQPLYRDVEIPLLTVLFDMERRGIRVDLAVVQEQSLALQEELNGIEEAVFASVGKSFNLNSPSQLAQILYDDLKILSGRKRSTRAEILEKLANQGVEIARQILDYRHRQKIKSTYLDSLSKLLRTETGRVHTTYHQTVVNTGRISSSDPNLQNIPIRTELGRRVRKAFTAEDGYQLLSLDYSQIELRILAHLSQDPGLLAAFSAGEDIHSRTAAEVFGVSIDQVDSDQRRKAKEINFGLNYGMSPYGLARRLGISDDEAGHYIEAYFSRYPCVQQYMDETAARAREQLYVNTLLGRRVPTPGVRDPNRMRQENARRAAINAPIQGSAADMLKIAMVRIHEGLKQRSEEAALILTVHDELVLEVREDCVDQVAAFCRDEMEKAVELSVPTPVEVFQGRRWSDLK